MAKNSPKKGSSCGHQGLVSVQNQHLLKFFLFLCIVRYTFRNATSNSHKMIFLPRPTIDRLSIAMSTECRPSINRVSTEYRPTVDRVSTDYRPSVDRLSTECRPLYRPISRSTLQTVNKIRLYLGSRNHQSNLRLQLKALLTPVGYKSCLKIYMLSLSCGITTIIVIIIILTVNVGTGTLVRNCSLYQVNDLIQKVQHLSQDISCTKQR